MSEALVTIIIPVYNNENYIEATLNSALQQTWKNIEIIAIDDGSTDKSLAILNKFKSSRVKVFSQPNKGASASRNRGLREAKGDYIQFLDGDDLLDSKKIENQLKIIEEIPYALAYGPVGYFKNDDALPDIEPISSLHEDYAPGYDFLFALYGGTSKKKEGGMVPVHAWLTPRQIITEAGQWNEEISVDDDGEFFCRVILKAETVKYVSNAIAYYRKYDSYTSLSSQKTREAYLSVLNAIKLKHQHIGDDKKINPLLANQAMHILNQLYPAEPALCKEINTYIKQLGGNNWQPYQHGIQKILRILFGWRFVKLLIYYKNKRSSRLTKSQG